MKQPWPVSPSPSRACALALAAMLLLASAVPGLGRDDIPELPAPDGSSDTPEMVIQMVDKTKVKLSSLRGKVVLLNFFLSTCPHCQEQAPHLAELYAQYRQRGLAVVGLASDPPTNGESVRAFVRNQKVTYPVGFITTELVAYYTDSHNHSVPQMVLFGPDGKMARRLIGWDEKNDKELRAAIQAQLQRLPTVKPGSKASGRPNRRRYAHA
jgi:peroxiredoxin